MANARFNTHENAVVWTLSEFCERYGISDSTTRREIRDGKLMALKYGTLLRIEKTEAARWFNAKREAAA